MAAAIKFYGGTNLDQDLGTLGQGLGFYGPGSFGSSVRVGQWNANQYCTDSTGAVEGVKCNSVTYVDSSNGQLGTGDTHALVDIPNQLSSVRLEFTNDTPVEVQNATATVFDRTTTTAPPSGVIVRVAELIHPLTTMNSGSPTGSGDATWSTPGGSGGLINGYTWDAPLTLTNSPGPSGLNAASGVATAQTTHTWHLVLSASPVSIGSKLAAILVSLEYL